MSEAQNSKYHVGVSWDKQTGCEIHIKDFPPIGIDLPAQYGGEGRYPCPHELFFSSLGSCFLATFLTFQKKLQLQLKDLQVSVKGSVDPITHGKEQGKYAITGIEMSVYVKVEGDQDEKDIAEDCIRLTEEHCPIGLALQKAVPIKIISQIETTIPSKV